ncbi:hypothetical protein TNCV_4110341 [Trichonephila clavipes]|nr:hypothetical protein TNCV_4110341 [Trichonephila clavipes]
MELFPLPAFSLDQTKTYAPCLHNDWPGIHHSLLHEINYDSMRKPHGLLYTKCTPKAFFILCRGVWQWLKTTMVATLSTDFVIIHSSQEAVVLIV